MHIYASINQTDITLIQEIIAHLFKENKSEILESGTVFISFGPVFECSLEPLYDNSLHFSADYEDTAENVLAWSQKFAAMMEEKGIRYELEIENEIEGEIKSTFIRHKDFH